MRSSAQYRPTETSYISLDDHLSITSPYFAKKTKFLCAYGKFRNILPHAA